MSDSTCAEPYWKNKVHQDKKNTQPFSMGLPPYGFGMVHPCCACEHLEMFMTCLIAVKSLFAACSSHEALRCVNLFIKEEMQTGWAAFRPHMFLCFCDSCDTLSESTYRCGASWADSPASTLCSPRSASDSDGGGEHVYFSDLHVYVKHGNKQLPANVRTHAHTHHDVQATLEKLQATVRLQFPAAGSPLEDVHLTCFDF